MRNKNRETVFRFKRFSVTNRKSAMKVGTDGVLLGAWAAIPDGRCLALDAGCGTGVISLMLAQRNEQSVVTGIEIDTDAADEATANAAASIFSGRVNIINGDFLDMDENCGFDLIACNPPFFTETTKSEDPARAAARTEGSLSLRSLLEKSRKLLNPSGKLAIVIPAQRRGEVEFESSLAGLYVTRVCSVVTVTGKPPRRLLIELSRNCAPCEESTLVISERTGDYTKEYIELLKDFYLKF